MGEGDTIELAGDHMSLEVDEKGAATIRFSPTSITGRVCGGCTLCCKLLPIPIEGELKPAGERCRHARAGKGCGIYAQRPMPCRTWACRWVADRETAGMPRPDRCHYVIDIQEDYVTLAPFDGGEPFKVGVIQVWVDPAFPEAAKAPELRAYMLRMAEKYRLATIVRFDSRRAYTVFPPPIADDGQWHEMGGSVEDRTPSEREVTVVFSDGEERTAIG